MGHVIDSALDVEEVDKKQAHLDKELPFADEVMNEKSTDNSSGLPADKATASITNLIQRTIAQLYHPQDIIPNVTQLPLLQLPDFRQLPGMGVVPWNAFSQMPAVFPIIVPIPVWPSLWGDKHEEGSDKGVAEGHMPNHRKLGGGPQLRTIWEKIVQNAAIATGNYRAEPPPPYRERASDVDEGSECNGEKDDSQQSISVLQRAGGRQSVRWVNYEDITVPEQEVSAYAYRPITKQNRKMQKKHDRMLVWFWIPILFIGFVWFFLQSIRACFGVVKDMIPVRAWMKV